MREYFLVNTKQKSNTAASRPLTYDSYEVKMPFTPQIYCNRRVNLARHMREGVATARPSAHYGGRRKRVLLRYAENSRGLNNGDLALIDAGREVDGYASDITRTFPVNGRFTEEQKAIYNLVHAAQPVSIDEVGPGKKFEDLHKTAVRVITKGLVALGILRGDVKKLIRDGEYKRFFMHRTSHWFGVDIHDAGDCVVNGAWRTLEPGMVLTVEPGIYIAPRSAGVNKK